MGIIVVAIWVKEFSTFLLSLPDPQSRACYSYAPKALEKVSSELEEVHSTGGKDVEVLKTKPDWTRLLGCNPFFMSGFNVFS